MIPARQLARSAGPRAARAARVPVPRPQQLRLQSTSSPPATSTASSTSHLASGLAGGVAGSLLLYGIYTMTPAGRAASKVNGAMSEANKKYQAAAKKLQEETPTADQAVDHIKQFAYSYVVWIPGGREYVDMAFNDWEAVRKNHKDEADEIINEAYKDIQEVVKSGLSLETASKAYAVLAKFSQKVASLGADAFADIAENHPQLKEKFGGSIDQLKSMGEQYGPEAKKQVDDTWNKVKGILAGGISAANLEKVRKLIEEKVEAVKKLGDEAWQKGLEEAKPYLDKNPKAKELIENNAEALKQGNFKELFDKARSAVESGDLGDLQKYVEKAAEKLKGSK